MIKDFSIKYKEQISYLIFGILTTLVNFLAYLFFNRFLNCTPLSSNLIAWFISVLFAFITNKMFVFNNTDFKTSFLLKELSEFLISRAFTGILDMFLFNYLVNNLSINDVFSKLLIGFIITILNYIISKFFIFKGDEQKHV